MTRQQKINHDASRLINAHKRGEPLPDVCAQAKAKARLQFKLERVWPTFKLGWYDSSA